MGFAAWLRAKVRRGVEHRHLDAFFQFFLAAQCLHEIIRYLRVQLHECLVRLHPDRTDVAFGDVTGAAQHRQQPAWLGLLVAPDGQGNPCAFGKFVARSAHVRSCDRNGLQFFRRRALIAILGDIGRCNLFGRMGRQQFGHEFQIHLVADLEAFQQAFVIAFLDLFGGGWCVPFGGDLGPAQQAFGLFALAHRHDQGRNPFGPRPTGAARAVQQRLFVLRQVRVDHQIKARQVNPARGNIGGNTNPRTTIAHGLQRVGALILAQLARQRHNGHATIVEFRGHMVHGGAGCTKHQRILRLVIAQQIDDRVFAVCRFHHQGAIFNVAVLLGVAFGFDPNRIVLISLGQHRNRARNCGGKQQGAAIFGGFVQNEFQIFAKPQIQHFVGFVQHHTGAIGQIQRAACQVVAQTARRADNDVNTTIQRAPFGAGVHAANAGPESRAGFGV